MPPPFVLEALCQAGTWLIMITTDRRKRAALLSIGSVDLARRRPARATCLSLKGHVDIVRRGDRGRVRPSDRRRQDRPGGSDIMCALIDADTLADLEDTERLQKMLTRAEDE